MSKTLLDLYAQYLDPWESPIGKGPKIAPLNWFVNMQKAGTLFIMLGLMIYYRNFSLGAWVYTALHGSYGMLWIMKDYVFPDKGFQQRVSLFAIVAVCLILVLYEGCGFLMMSRFVDNNPSPERVFFCIFIYVFGVSLMLLTDLQKYITLKYKKGLIDDHFLATNRNTNYFGEIMLYSSFAVLVNHRYAFYFLFFVWGTVFVSRIYLKEKSLRQKEGYKNYAQNSYLLVFKFFRSDFLNIVFYFNIALVIYYFNNVTGFEQLLNSVWYKD
jgi:protein-S-isoprenylcysteine O-methyltransferase Ste14